VGVEVGLNSETKPIQDIDEDQDERNGMKEMLDENRNE
jgi:hypothetical protein